MHMNFGIDVINQIKNENPSLWTEEFQQDMIKLIKTGVDLETQYGYYAETYAWYGCSKI